MGVSILSGLITTFGSGSALLFCDFLFFKKFGMTISITVLFAFIISTFVFGAFMHTMGPQKDCCDPISSCFQNKKLVEEV